MLNLVLFGPPGAGKGTQAEFLIKNFGLTHLSTGDLLREEIAAQTTSGLAAKTFIDKGELVPDSVVIGMIKIKIDSIKEAKGFIFDGFPRTVPQAVALDQLLESYNTPVAAMLCLDVPKSVLMDRLLNRGLTSGRSDDQCTEIIENRIAVYNEKTAPIIKHYDKVGKYISVDGVGTIEQIANRLKTTVEGLQ
jgi:adenylate kinase